MSHRLGDAVRRWRREHGYTQVELANRVGARQGWATYFPSGGSPGVPTDNPFPLAVSPRLQIAYTPLPIPTDRPVNMMFSSLDGSTGENVSSVDILFNGGVVGSSGSSFAYTFKSTWTNRTVIGVDGKPHVIRVRQCHPSRVSPARRATPIRTSD
jgi:hypothetical protein